MSNEENNINEKEETILNDTKSNDETNNKSEELLTEEKKEDNSNVEKNKPSLLKRIFAGVIDQVVTLAISGLLLIVFDFIIKFIGYMVAMPLGILIIFYFIINVIYISLMDSTKSGQSIGKRIFNIK
ncbi:RDD family protein [Clostridium taeniosporum]|uniref:RDD family protein n=1 Tax=Clostridium taeniosporum TaxID=394958 RepID=A0A1D7XH76_9CLOT|nr:RDD family protein [Clostridium taeniosporum]AOR22697.1 RDD family protein [Clostridium taeniosporum]